MLMGCIDFLREVQTLSLKVWVQRKLDIHESLTWMGEDGKTQMVHDWPDFGLFARDVKPPRGVALRSTNIAMYICPLPEQSA